MTVGGMMSKRRLFAGASITALGVSWLAVQPALADPSWDDPDDNPHTWCFGANMGTWERDQVFSKMASIDAATDVSQGYDASCNWSSGSMTDMHVMDVNLEPGVRGEAQCTGRHWYGPCDRYDVRVDEGEIFQQAQASGLRFRKNHGKTFCHEIGHTLSLSHYNKDATPPGGVHDCMVSGEVTEFDVFQTFNSHHINDHINVQF